MTEQSQKTWKLWMIVATGGCLILLALVFWLALARNAVSQEDQRDTFCELAGILYVNTLNARQRSLNLATTRGQVAIINASFAQSLARLEALPCDYKEAP